MGHPPVWLNKEQSCGFKGVPDAVWGLHIGGYQVCEKWLKTESMAGHPAPHPYDWCALSNRLRKFFAQPRKAASISPHFWNALSPLNNLLRSSGHERHIYLANTESTISPSIETLPTLSLGTNKPPPRREPAA